MLVLLRRVGQKVVVGAAGEVVLTVTKIFRDGRGKPVKVEIGVEAPREVPVRRAESPLPPPD